MDSRERCRVLIIGAGTIASTLACSLQSSGRYHVLGFIADGTELEAGCVARPLLGFREDAADLVEKLRIERVFIASEPSWRQELVDSLISQRPSLDVTVVPDYYESMLSTGVIENHEDIALVHLRRGAGKGYAALKRTLDVIAAGMGVVVLAPIMLIVCLLVRLTSRGPAIFRQERVGRNGRPFLILKFRTMRVDAEEATGPVLSPGDSDSRVTRVGRWLRAYRIDEIPQLWNVVRGEMSLVGPRPERTCFVREHESNIPAYMRRHQVRPGITGLAQVCGNYHTEPEDKLRFDLIYVAHQSLWYDLAILFRTIRVVLRPTDTAPAEGVIPLDSDAGLESYPVGATVRGQQEL